MDETLAMVSDDDKQVIVINEKDDQMSSKDESFKKGKGSYKQKYKRAWELDSELRGKSFGVLV